MQWHPPQPSTSIREMAYPRSERPFEQTRERQHIVDPLAVGREGSTALVAPPPARSPDRDSTRPGSPGPGRTHSGLIKPFTPVVAITMSALSMIVLERGALAAQHPQSLDRVRTAIRAENALNSISAEQPHDAGARGSETNLPTTLSRKLRPA